MARAAESTLQAYNATIVDKALVTDVGLIALLWAVCGLVINPVAEFPLNDDWSYGLAVQRLIETGEYRPLGWTAMPLSIGTRL